MYICRIASVSRLDRTQNMPWRTRTTNWRVDGRRPRRTETNRVHAVPPSEICSYPPPQSLFPSTLVCVSFAKPMLKYSYISSRNTAASCMHGRKPAGGGGVVVLDCLLHYGIRTKMLGARRLYRFRHQPHAMAAIPRIQRRLTPRLRNATQLRVVQRGAKKILH